jgi:LPS-assembly lipoprotein
VLRLAAVVAFAGVLAGCFQPMYGDRALNGGPGLRQALAAIEVAQIQAPPATPLARLAVELRNELTFQLDGGGGRLPPTHRLEVSITLSATSIIVDPTTARPEDEIIAVNAVYKLIEMGTQKVATDGFSSVRVTYDIPGQQQRFGVLRGQRDAQSRAVKVVAEQIRSRLAAFYATAGT